MDSPLSPSLPPDDAAILAIERPHSSLWTYYLLNCLVVPPLFPFLVLPMYFRYHTLRYKFTAEGISMSWGLLFRREIIIHYARIQDIHLRSNIVERWLGLAKVLIQTASGSSGAEMTLEGLKEFEAVRDFLYSQDARRERPGACRCCPGSGRQRAGHRTRGRLARGGSRTARNPAGLAGRPPAAPESPHG